MLTIFFGISSSDIDQALYLFNELREQDPFRIENMDTFSNLLYVRVRVPNEFVYAYVLGNSVVDDTAILFKICCFLSEYEARAQLLGT